MPNLSTYAKGELIKHYFRTGATTKPTAIYIALFVGAVEVTGGGYARVAYGPSDTTWTDQTAGNGRTSNIGDIIFPAPSAAWGLISGFKIMDAAIGGNILVSGNLAAAKTVNATDPAPTFPAGTLVGIFA